MKTLFSYVFSPLSFMIESGCSSSVFASSHRSAILLCPARKNGLETCGILRLRFLHLLPHEEFSHLGDVTNVNREMHAAGPFGERLDAVALAERVGSLGLGGQGQKAILLKLGYAHRLLALVT